jgi:hypothetical protein
MTNELVGIWFFDPHPSAAGGAASTPTAPSDHAGSRRSSPAATGARGRPYDAARQEAMDLPRGGQDRLSGAQGRPGARLSRHRPEGYDGVLTISNQITATSSQSPLSVDGRRLRSTRLWNFSWWRIITEAIVQSR